MTSSYDLFAGRAGAPDPAPKQTAPKGAGKAGSYTAADIEILEGLEPVRRRPGMYIGGTDEKALHHLFAEVIDNAMDEAVEGHAARITVEMEADGFVSVRDDGRGIPVDPHPKFTDKSALEVILTTLHSGGKFNSKVYATSGGLHGVGVSVVNALAARLEVEVARDGALWRQVYARGAPLGPPERVGPVRGRRGTMMRFLPDPEIFGEGAAFRAARIFRMSRAKAYLFGGVKISWSCDAELIGASDDIPAQAEFHFPGGLADFLAERTAGAATVTPAPFAGRHKLDPGSASGTGTGHGTVEWAIAWLGDRDGFMSSYCNTVPTPEGGTHETGLRAALSKGLRAYGEMVGNRRAAQITAEDVMAAAGAMLSVFIREPEFQGQTKEKLASQSAARIVEQAVRDEFDHWLTASPAQASRLLDFVIERAEDRLRRKREKEVGRKAATRKLRLPGKLADCAQNTAAGSEIFIVEGDSAGGSAKQARDRRTQAVLPLRGKILNVANASSAKLAQNQLLSDLVLALGCGTGSAFRAEDLRYERVIVMTDADVDGAHIASLLITYFFREMRGLIEGGHLYLAVPPLYRLTQSGKTLYARDDAHKDALMASEFTGKGKVEIGRFKGLGEMMPAQLKETTMSPATRSLLRVAIGEDGGATAGVVDRLMGTKPEARFAFIQERAPYADGLDI